MSLHDAAMLHFSFSLGLFMQQDTIATKETLRAILDFLDNKADLAEYSARYSAATRQLAISAALYHGLAPTAH